MQVRKLNHQEAIFFEALTKDRIESAMMLEKPSMRGIKNSVVEKYSDLNCSNLCGQYKKRSYEDNI